MSTTHASALSLYRAEIAHCSRLTPEVERALAVAYQGGDRRAGGRLVEGCLGTVIAVALRYRRWGAPLEDLVQEGNVGLLKAVEHFDPERGARLATYATYWIRAEIREYVARNYRIVRLGSSRSERRVVRAYRQTREQRPEVLAAMSGLPVERVTELLPLLIEEDVSLSQAPAEGGLTILERLACGVASAEDALSDQEERRRLRVAVASALVGLPAREQDIVRRRLLVEPPATLERLGETWGVTKERMRARLERVGAATVQRASGSRAVG